MEKKFEMSTKGLLVTVESEDKLWLPNAELEDGKEFIGTYTQTTQQIIAKDKAHVLRAFIAEEKAKGDTQAELIDSKLEELKDIKENELDADLVKAVKETIDKGSKERRSHLTALNGYIEKMGMKQQFMQQKEFITTELVRMNKELADIDKALV